VANTENANVNWKIFALPPDHQQQKRQQQLQQHSCRKIGELRWAWHGVVGGVGDRVWGCKHNVCVSSALNVAIYAPKTMLRQPHE